MVAVGPIPERLRGTERAGRPRYRGSLLPHGAKPTRHNAGAFARYKRRMTYAAGGADGGTGGQSPHAKKSFHKAGGSVKMCAARSSTAALKRVVGAASGERW
jgi:hypothetical protein